MHTPASWWGRWSESSSWWWWRAAIVGRWRSKPHSRPWTTRRRSEAATRGWRRLKPLVGRSGWIAAHGRPLGCFTIRSDPKKTMTVADDASLPTNNNGAVLGWKLIFRSTYRRTVGLRSRMTSLWRKVIPQWLTSRPYLSMCPYQRLVRLKQLLRCVHCPKTETKSGNYERPFQKIWFYYFMA
jgi:hypothetical protein